MDAEQMRAEFEAWAKAEGFDLSRWIKVESDGQLIPTEYADATTRAAEKAYAAGRKAEREAMRLKNWDGIRLGTTGKLEGER